MAISFACTVCGTRMKIPDGAAGQEVPCAQCGASVRVPLPSSAPQAEITVPCPFCMKAIPATARACRHCGELVNGYGGSVGGFGSGGYRRYSDVTWYRRSGVNSAFILVNFLSCGYIPLLIWVCVNLLTGDVYYNRKDTNGELKTWSFGNKIVAAILLIFNVILLINRVIPQQNPLR